MYRSPKKTHQLRALSALSLLRIVTIICFSSVREDTQPGAAVTWFSVWFLRSGCVSSCAGADPHSHFAEFLLSPQRSRRDERIRVRLSSAAVRPPRLRLNESCPVWCFPPERHLGENAPSGFCDFTRSPSRRRWVQVRPLRAATIWSQREISATIKPNWSLHSCATALKCAAYLAQTFLNHLTLKQTVPKCLQLDLMQFHLDNKTGYFLWLQYKHSIFIFYLAMIRHWLAPLRYLVMSLRTDEKRCCGTGANIEVTLKCSYSYLSAARVILPPASLARALTLDVGSLLLMRFPLSEVLRDGILLSELLPHLCPI